MAVKCLLKIFVFVVCLVSTCQSKRHSPLIIPRMDDRWRPLMRAGYLANSLIFTENVDTSDCRIITARGFVLTAPKVLDAGTIEYFTLTVFDVPNGGGPVTVKLLKGYFSEDVIAEATVLTQNGHTKWIRMAIPDVEATEATIHITGEFRPGNYVIDSKEVVALRRKSVVTFIQTDKPIYKPGQTVRFRILSLDSQLEPLSGQTMGDVFIEDPSKVRVAQWMQVNLTKGITQLDLPLSDEPPYGKWIIYANVRNFTESQGFEVKEYVLPKFEVIIHPPKFLMVNAKEFPVKVCATYTYGKNVEGQLSTNIILDSASPDEQAIEQPKTEISGCREFRIKISNLQNSKKVTVFAEVLENSTGIVRNGTATITVVKSPLKLKFLGADKDSHYFKPGLPYHGKLQVLKPDGGYAVSQMVKICAALTFRHDQNHRERNYHGPTELCNTFQSEKDGLITFIVPPQDPSVNKIILTAKAVYGDGDRPEDGAVIPQAQIRLKVWFSPSQSYLQIQALKEDLPCNRLQRVKFLYTNTQKSDIKLYHQVFARGRIIQLGSHHRSFYDSVQTRQSLNPNLLLKETSYTRPRYGPYSGFSTHYGTVFMGNYSEFTLTFDARNAVSHVARLLVFYVRDDGEVVADAKTFTLSQCLRNKVKLLFRHAMQYPDTEASMLLSASPMSLCGINMVDRSMHLMSEKQGFGKDQVFDVMKTFDVGKKNGRKQMYPGVCRRGLWGWDDFENFELKRRRRSVLFPSFEDTYADAMTAYEEAGSIVMTDFKVKTSPCVPLPSALPRAGHPHLLSGRRFFKEAVPLSGPLSYPPSHLVDGVVTPEADSPEIVPEPTLEIRSYFPETWLWEIQEVGTSGEIALKRNLPHTITEWVGTAVCIHHKYGLGISDTARIVSYQPFFVSFSLPYSVIRGETVPIVVSVFNYLSECLPIKLSLELSESFETLDSDNADLCICGSKSGSHKFQIRPLIVGNMKITAYAFSLQNDVVCGNEVTAKLGARDAVTRELKVEAEGFPVEETFNSYFCPQKANGSYSEEFDLLLPDNVVEDSARCYVSITGDLMGPTLNGLEKLVRLPVGCGEQNMVLFTPNIYTLDYLTNVGRLDRETEEKALNYMRKGYQRELNYRHSEGSYSAFGERDKEGSMWLTAFVVKSFASARRFIHIDERDLSLSIRWILERQLENGCFQSTGYVAHKELQGGLTGKDESLAPLTAYVLISLLEAGYTRDEIVKNALLCLTSSSPSNTYVLALYAYAAALAKSDVAAKYLAELEERAIDDGNLMHWDHENGKNSKAINVEIAGYAIMAMIELGGASNLSSAVPVVRWIAHQRNSNGGFVSTQDTVVALQALAKYAVLGAKDQVNIGIAIEADDFVQGFKVDETNKLVTQTVRLSTLPTVVDFQAAGEGCALAQFALKYNVRTAKESRLFDLKVKGSREGSSGCNIPSIGICMRYKIPNEASNMAVVEVKMVSGYVPDEWNLHRLRNDEELELKRHETDGNIVNLYFMKLTIEEKCFRLIVKRNIDFKDPKEATVRLYDYYQPENEVTHSYSIPETCSPEQLPDLPHIPPAYTFTEEPEENDHSIQKTGSDSVSSQTATNEPDEPEQSQTEVIQTSAIPELDSTVQEISNEDDVSEHEDAEQSSDHLTEADPETGLLQPSPPQENPSGLYSTDRLSTEHPPAGITVPDTTETSTLPGSAGQLENDTVAGGQEALTSDKDGNSDSFDLGQSDSSDVSPGPDMHDTITVMTSSPEEQLLGDDAGRNAHLRTFVVFNETLDFPEGVEGNQPAFVTPPSGFEYAPSASAQVTVDCPVCTSEFPENFTDIYCSSVGLRISVRNRRTSAVKILHDISAAHARPKPINAFGVLFYDSTCVCPQIKQGAVIFLFGPESMWTSDGDEHSLSLGSGVHVISVQSKTARPPQVKAARRKCN